MRGREGLSVMKAAENGGCGQLTGCGCSARSEPARAGGGLRVQAAMGAAVVIADVLAKDALGVALAEEQDVIEAVATERPNQALANRVRLRRSWRRAEAPHPKTAEPRAKARIVDAIAVVQQIARRFVADGLDRALSDPRARRVRGDTDVDDPAALEGGDDERVEGLEVDGDHREEVAGPNLRGMVPEKGPPVLTAATLQVLRCPLTRWHVR